MCIAVQNRWIFLVPTGSSTLHATTPYFLSFPPPPPKDIIDAIDSLQCTIIFGSRSIQLQPRYHGLGRLHRSRKMAREGAMSSQHILLFLKASTMGSFLRAHCLYKESHWSNTRTRIAAKIGFLSTNKTKS